MNFKLAKQLIDAGFPIEDCEYWTCPHPEKRADGFLDPNHKTHDCQDEIIYPSLSGLIEACGDDFAFLSAIKDESDKITKWHAGSWHSGSNLCIDEDCCDDVNVGKTPDIAVSKLWLSLNKKK